MKNKQMLINFLAILLTAILLGIVAGRYVSASGMYISLAPPLYMQRLVYASPFFMIPAVVGLVVYIGGRGRYPRLPLLLSVYVYTVIGVIVSGFCGLYTMKNFVPAAAGVVTGVIVILALMLVQGYSNSNTLKISRRKNLYSSFQLMAFGIYAVMVLISVVVPIGPLPVILVGTLWALATSGYGVL